MRSHAHEQCWSAQRRSRVPVIECCDMDDPHARARPAQPHAPDIRQACQACPPDDWPRPVGQCGHLAVHDGLRDGALEEVPVAPAHRGCQSTVRRRLAKEARQAHTEDS